MPPCTGDPRRGFNRRVLRTRRPATSDLGQYPQEAVSPRRIGSICQGALWGTVGYNAICETSRQILSGCYEYPPDFDNATKEILQECTQIRSNIPAASLDNRIGREDWESHWRRAKEETFSLISGRHFGHYKAGLRSAYISHTQALISSIVTKEGLVLERWSQGLLVMLEKIPGCALINKLWSILLMEADFNTTNKML
jgi:hypothetical protein